MTASTALRRDAAWLLVGLAGLIAWDAVGPDLAMTRLFGSAAGFAWRDHWLVGGVLHAGARWLAWAVCLTLAVGIRHPLPFARRVPRRERIRWLVATLACVGLVPLLKRGSLTSCPWSLAEFGGVASYVSHWTFGVADGGDGRCFPAGHATAAFCFLPGWFALRSVAPVAARRWLLTVLVAGAVLAGVQVMRGAHFLSHSLWTGWFCWCIAAVAWHARRVRAASASAPTPTPLDVSA